LQDDHAAITARQEALAQRRQEQIANAYKAKMFNQGAPAANAAPKPSGIAGSGGF
jgi:hypothetical protein